MELLSFYSFLLKQCQILVLCNITHAGIWALTKKGSVQPSHGWARTTRRVLVVLDPHICTNITKGPGHWQRRGCPGHSRPPPPATSAALDHMLFKGQRMSVQTVSKPIWGFWVMGEGSTGISVVVCSEPHHGGSVTYVFLTLAGSTSFKYGGQNY